MTQQKDYTMSETEAMQAARSVLWALDDFAFWVRINNNTMGLGFHEARRLVLSAVESGDLCFGHYSPEWLPAEMVSEILSEVFPEISQQGRERLIKWQKKKIHRDLQIKSPDVEIYFAASKMAERLVGYPQKDVGKPSDSGRWNATVAAYSHMLKRRIDRNQPHHVGYTIVRTSNRYRSSVHSSNKRNDGSGSGGGGGDSDGDSDQGDPPGPSFVVPSLQTSQLNPILYSSAFSRIVHPCSCCMGGRWSV